MPRTRLLATAPLKTAARRKPAATKTIAAISLLPGQLKRMGPKALFARFAVFRSCGSRRVLLCKIVLYGKDFLKRMLPRQSTVLFVAAWWMI